MRTTFEVGSYNTRRYGKPWIAKVTKWDVGKHPEIEFGVSVDAHQAEIDAEPGQIIRYGQKDHRGNGTMNNWAILLQDGEFFYSDARKCREHWERKCPVINAEGEPVETNVVQLNQVEA